MLTQNDGIVLGLSEEEVEKAGIALPIFRPH